MTRRRGWQRAETPPAAGGGGARVRPLLVSMFLINVFGYAAISGVLSVLLPTQIARCRDL
ncbi:hypothetical protein ACFW24_37435 [Streptomyces nigra]|uniref:hypothetical protein n=1 Tax=Streptomyces nigra TaxID=1827580 RepID=UPI0036CEA33A